MKHTSAALNYRCPDCNNDTRLVQVAPNVWSLQVLHDDTCPTLGALVARTAEAVTNTDDETERQQIIRAAEIAHLEGLRRTTQPDNTTFEEITRQIEQDES